MKILKIEFQNINSLKGTHQIDFSRAPFTVSSLFAITGPTGSGKSTILDVISLALFNMVPRLGKISKNDILNKGALLTRNQKEAFARVTYQTKSGIYASVWSISTNRNNNLRDYEMQIFDLATEKALDYKKSDVPSKNEELIGLNYNQFIKSVLLAQGDFAQFLKAKKDERGELLEKITGTGIYRQLGIRARQKFNFVNAKIEDRQREINLLKNDLLEEQALEALNSTLAEKTAACAPLEKNIQQLDRQLQLKKNISEQAEHISRQEKLKVLANKELQEFESVYKDKIEKHEQVQEFAEELRSWQLLDKTCKELKEELAAHASKKQGNVQGINSCLEKITTFLNSKPDTEKIEESLQEFSKKIRNLQEKKAEKSTSFINLKERFHTEVREVPFKLNGDLEQETLKLKEIYNSGASRLLELREQLKEVDLTQPEAEKVRLRKAIQQGRQAQQKAISLDHLSTEIKRLEKEKETLAPDVKELPKQIKLIGAQAETLRERLQKLQLQRENEILKANLQEHRHNLQKGEPCPLCGAKEHPFATALPPTNDKLQQEITTTQKNLDQLEKQVTRFSTSLDHHQKRLNEVERNLEEKQSHLEVQKSHFKKEFFDLNPSGENWDQFCSSRENKLQLLEQFELEKRKVNAVINGLKIIPEIKEVVSQGKQIRAELDSLYSGNDIDTDCLELQRTWSGLQHEKRSLNQLFNDLNSKLEGNSAELETAESSLHPKITAIDCKEIKEALQRLVPEGEYAGLRKKRENLTSQKGQIEASLNTLKEQLERLNQNDVETSREVLLEELRLSKEHFNSLKEECEALRRQQLNDLERREKILKIEQELAGAKKSIKRWELLNTLIGDATGKKFNDFAQDLSLSQLLILANKRLIDLSDRYRIDKPMEDEDDSLVAIDEHMGGQRRSVKTLSGGETFILSLSMALALSDLASKNVEINSLFIDEGFGTLDPETLDQTLDTLEKLQAESSKTIGVISHVESLKERIATQIRLTRNGQGYSSLEVIG